MPTRLREVRRSTKTWLSCSLVTVGHALLFKDPGGDLLQGRRPGYGQELSSGCPSPYYGSPRSFRVAGTLCSPETLAPGPREQLLLSYA